MERIYDLFHEYIKNGDDLEELSKQFDFSELDYLSSAEFLEFEKIVSNLLQDNAGKRDFVKCLNSALEMLREDK